MKILIIDDDIVVHELSSRLLEIADHNCTVISSFNGKQGFDFIVKHIEESDVLPDVILLDMKMPVLDGWGFLEQFRLLKFGKNKPTVYILSTEDYDMKALTCFPIQGTYAKPLSFSAINQIMQYKSA